MKEIPPISRLDGFLKDKSFVPFKSPKKDKRRALEIRVGRVAYFYIGKEVLGALFICSPECGMKIGNLLQKKKPANL